MLDKIFNVFTKEYRKETRYMEYMESMKEQIYLKDYGEDVDIKIKRLISINFISKFYINSENKL